MFMVCMGVCEGGYGLIRRFFLDGWRCGFVFLVLFI